MSQELQQDYLSAKNVYFLVRTAVGTIWNGSAFVAYATVNYALYPITGTEQGSASGFYTASMPTSIPGIYSVIAKERIGGSPAESDITIGSGNFNWAGASVVANPWQTILTGTATAGAATTITLDSNASTTANIYRGGFITIISGPGQGQTRTINTYSAARVVNIDRPWVTNPTSASVYAITAVNSPMLNAALQVSAASTLVVIRSGTAQAGGTLNTIKLDAAASATNNIYVGNVVTLTVGTGLGQTRSIISYNGTTKVATVAPPWTGAATIPDATTTFNILASTQPSLYSDQGVAQAGSSTTITLATTASATTDIYVGSFVTILSGTDQGDTAEITAYNGTTKVATVASPGFAVSPDTTSAYAVIPTVSGGGGAPPQVDVNVISFDPAALAQFFLTDTGYTFPDAVDGSVVFETADNANVIHFEDNALAQFFDSDCGLIWQDAVGGSVVGEGIKGVFQADMSQFEDDANLQSLCGVTLKLTSEFDALIGTTYRTDGDPFMVQTPTTNPSMVPIQKLAKGV